jgi:DNA-directed RNA polymerase specialized sigma24 family protein
VNEALLRVVHRAIRGDRAALRTLVERYQGLTYALAYRRTPSFPRAQSLALSAWPRVGMRLPGLAEPERFPDLLAAAVEEAARIPSPSPAETEDDADAAAGHSVLRTEKVQARRALRRALSNCPRPEASVFFLRYVEGQTLEQIAELYGVETLAVLESLKIVCVDLAYRAGFVGTPGDPPSFEQFTPEHREALGFAVHQAEGGLSSEATERLGRYIQEHPDVRREEEGVRNVLSLAAGTFAAHRLPPEFSRDVLLAIPFTELRPVLPQTSPAFRTEVPQGPMVFVGLGGMLAGMLGTIWMAKVVESIIGRVPATSPPWLMDEATHAAVLILTLGVALLSLALACPPVWRKDLRLAPAYYVAYGLLCGAPVAMTVYSSFSTHPWAGLLAWSGLAPLWAVACLGLLAVRAGLLYREMEKRVELRLRRIEEAMVSVAARQTQADAAPATTPRAGA